MNYTEFYKKVYNTMSHLDIPHEKKHNASLRIVNAMTDIYLYTNKQFPEIMEDIMDVVEEFSKTVKVVDLEA
jgi:hypothetical protein